jgi:hypothetical protein
VRLVAANLGNNCPLLSARLVGRGLVPVPVQSWRQPQCRHPPSRPSPTTSTLPPPATTCRPCKRASSSRTASRYPNSTRKAQSLRSAPRLLSHGSRQICSCGNRAAFLDFAAASPGNLAACLILGAALDSGPRCPCQSQDFLFWD